jgi:proteasome assembly chaperone (PAC2) family protein
VGDLETLEAVASLSLATNNIDNLVDELGTLGVMTLGPVVTGTRLAEDEVVGTEELTEGTGTDGVHGTGLKVNEDGTRNILVSAGLVEVDVHALELEVGGAIEDTGAIKAVLARDGLPESGTNLVTTLAGLQMNDLTHCGRMVNGAVQI